jgi:hypothetical protein
LFAPCAPSWPARAVSLRFHRLRVQLPSRRTAIADEHDLVVVSILHNSSRPPASCFSFTFTSWCSTVVIFLVLSRDENGRNFSRTVPFRFLYFSVRFRICEIPFLYLRK